MMIGKNARRDSKRERISTVGKSKQIGLTTAGGHAHCEDTCIASVDKLAYSVPLATYVYTTFDGGGGKEFHLSSVICNHSKLITGLCWHPTDTNLIVTAGADHRLSIWNLEKQKELNSVNDLKGIPTSVQWNCHNYEQIVFILNRRDVFVWSNVLDGSSSSISRYKSTTPDDCSFNCDILKFRFHSKNFKIAFGHINGTLSLVYQTKNKRSRKYLLKEETNNDDTLFALEWDPFSCDQQSLSSYLLISSRVSGLRLLDISDSSSDFCSVICRYELPSRSACVRSLTWLSNGHGLFVTGDLSTGVLRIWNVANRQPIQTVTLQKAGILSISALGDTNSEEASSSQFYFKLLLSFSDGGIGLYHYGDREWLFYNRPGHLETIFDCKFNNIDSNNVQLATASFDGTVKTWSSINSSTNNWQLMDSTPFEKKSMICNTNAIEDHIGAVYSVSWAPRCNSLLTGTAQSGCFVWDFDKRCLLVQFLHSNEMRHASVFCVAWNQRDGALLATAGADACCTIWQIFHSNEESSSRKSKNNAFSMSVRMLNQYKHPDTVYGCDWNPNEKDMLATGCSDFNVRVYYLLQHQSSALKTFTGHTAKVFQVKWHPVLDGILASSSDDRTVRVWSYALNGCIMQLDGHTEPVRALCWHLEQNDLLLSGSWDSEIRVWNIRSGHCLDTMQEHFADVYGLAAHPVKRFLFVSVSRDATCRFWDLSNLASDLFCRALFRLSPAETNAPTLSPTPKSSYRELTEEDKIMSPLLQSMRRVMMESGDGGDQDPKRGVLKLLNLFIVDDLTQLWDLLEVVVHQVKDILLSASYFNPDKIVHWSHVSKVYSANSAQLLIQIKQTEYDEMNGTNRKSCSIVNKRRNEKDKIRELAIAFARLGDLTRFCDLCIQIDEWEKALAVAPAVSIDYWRQLTEKYIQHLETKEETPECTSSRDSCNGNNATHSLDLILPFSVAIGQIDRLCDSYLSKCQFKNALIAATASFSSSNDDNTNLSKKEKKKNKLNSSSTIVKVYTEYGKWLFASARVIEAVCCHLAIDNLQEAIHCLLQANQLEMVIALNELLLMDNSWSILIQELSDRACSYLWFRFVQNNHDLSIDIINRIKDKEKRHICKLKLCSFINDENKELFYKRCNLPTISECSTVANKLSEELNKINKDEDNEKLLKMISFYLLAANVEMAIQKTFDFLRKRKEKKSVIDVDRFFFLIVDLLNYVSESALAKMQTRRKLELLCLSFYAGALLAIRRQYTDCIINVLFDLTRQLLEELLKMKQEEKNIDEELTSLISLELIEQEEELWKKKKNYIKKELNNSELTNSRNTDLECGPIVTPGSFLPTANTNRKKYSLFSNELIQGSVFLLEDTKTAISLNEALMWYRVTPFSPLATGARISPF